MIITFCGNDGVGKSTFTSMTKVLLEERGKEVRLQSEYDFIIVKVMKLLLGEKLFVQYNKTKMEKRQDLKTSSFFSNLVTLFYPVTIYLSFLIKYIQYEIIRKKKILICDRYIYDYLFTLRRQGISNKLSEFLFLKFPTPTAIFIIRVPPKIILQRIANRDFKYGLEFYEFQDHNYLFLCKTKNIKIINNESLPQAFTEVKETINRIV